MIDDVDVVVAMGNIELSCSIWKSFVDEWLWLWWCVCCCAFIDNGDGVDDDDADVDDDVDDDDDDVEFDVDVWALFITKLLKLIIWFWAPTTKP